MKNHARHFWGHVDKTIRVIRVFGWTVGVIVTLGALASSDAGESSLWTVASKNPQRLVSSLNFPQVKATNDVEDILEAYPAYLKFVLEIGRQSDSKTAQRLADTYNALRKRDAEAAARFLKGLRFEMVQHLELKGTSPAMASSQNPKMRRWVAKYMKEWLREADEHLFRSVTMQRGIGR